MAHGRYRYEALDPASGLRKGTCHVLFADGEIALLDPDSDFSPVEPLKAISGISVERSLLAKKSTLRFDLSGMAIKLQDTVSSDEMARQITTSLARMFPGAMPLKDVKWFEPQVRIARDEFKKNKERAESAEYAATGRDFTEGSQEASWREKAESHLSDLLLARLNGVRWMGRHN